MWHVDCTLLTGADLSAEQYRFVNAGGTLAGSETNVFGINQSKGKERDHIPATKFGFSRLHMAEPVDSGAKVGQSNVTFGAGAIVTCGGMYFAEVLTGCVSGGIAQVTCFGTPQFLAK